jgi:hypothetical protein
LPQAQEEERFRVLGQLLTEDPVWALARQIEADISAIVALPKKTPADTAVLEDLKDFLAVSSGIADRANTQAEAEGYAMTLRQFFVRRDASGAVAWAKSQ